ncbi:hypothetical protein [Sporisorium scitamineum]|uniref:Uncharacterized protein n=1 Tax=Sporisorium scitamineum TaxID=49012 RepID=A0A0F7RW74_9BASI|nr:hypothetical protein [Sporisorium scitamineum]
MARMRRLISSSVSHGVTSMCAFVEVDPTVGLMGLDAAKKLKRAYEASCDVQIVAFAQDAVFYPDDEGKEDEMQRLLREATSREEVDVVGSAPYVEALSVYDRQNLSEGERRRKQKQQQQRNIRFVFDLARQHGKHEDLDQLSTTFSTAGDTVPPVSFVSLPPSDLYMQGRTQPYASRSRATLPLLTLQSHPNLRQHTNWAMGVNNVANLFTPQGDADPLAMLPMMVGVWQSARPRDCEVLLGAVSRGARVAAGLETGGVHTELFEDHTQGWTAGL